MAHLGTISTLVIDGFVDAFGPSLGVAGEGEFTGAGVAVGAADGELIYSVWEFSGSGVASGSFEPVITTESSFVGRGTANGVCYHPYLDFNAEGAGVALGIATAPDYQDRDATAAASTGGTIYGAPDSQERVVTAQGVAAGSFTPPDYQDRDFFGEGTSTAAGSMTQIVSSDFGSTGFGMAGGVAWGEFFDANPSDTVATAQGRAGGLFFPPDYQDTQFFGGSTAQGWCYTSRLFSSQYAGRGAGTGGFRPESFNAAEFAGSAHAAGTAQHDSTYGPVFNGNGQALGSAQGETAVECVVSGTGLADGSFMGDLHTALFATGSGVANGLADMDTPPPPRVPRKNTRVINLPIRQTFLTMRPLQ